MKGVFVVESNDTRRVSDRMTYRVSSTSYSQTSHLLTYRLSLRTRSRRRGWWNCKQTVTELPQTVRRMSNHPRYYRVVPRTTDLRVSFTDNRSSTRPDGRGYSSRRPTSPLRCDSKTSHDCRCPWSVSGNGGSEVVHLGGDC